MSLTFLYKIMEKYKIVNRKILKKKEKVAVSVVNWPEMCFFFQEVSVFDKGCHVTGNDNILLIGLLNYTLDSHTSSCCVNRLRQCDSDPHSSCDVSTI